MIDKLFIIWFNLYESLFRPAIILTHGTLSWHQLQILMSRSTTPDLLKMQLKLEEFFTQQFKSSKRVFSSLHPNYTNARRDRRGGEFTLVQIMLSYTVPARSKIKRAAHFKNNVTQPAQ